VIAPIVAMCIGMGVAPGVFLKPMEPAVTRIVQQVRGLMPVNASAQPAEAGRSPERAQARVDGGVEGR
jgi:hypothetical protein